MKKYDSYKNSQIEWIGDVPSHWESWKISHAFNRIGSGTTPESGNPIYHENGTINWLNTGDLNDGVLDSCSKKITTKALDDYSSLKLFPTGSLVMAMYGATIGKTAILNFETTTNQACCVFCDSSIIDLKFLQYWFIGNKEQIINLAIGGGQPNISQNILKDIRVWCPDYSEQGSLTNFLDHKTTKIEHLIAKKEQFIQLLEEERVAVINQAVTKGLDPNVSMKDSGIEWLGKIPEHWESYRIDWVANIVRGNTGFRKDELLDSGDYVALQYGKTYKVDIVDNSFNFFVNSEFYKESQIVTKGDTILISTSETFEDLGHTCFYINENDGLLGGEQILLKPNRTVLNEKYLYQYVRQFCRELQKYAKGLKVFRFSTHDLKQIFIAIPTIEEQIKIVDFLDIETIRIDSLTSKMEKEIELLKEYKTALISEVVTGKVDVRNEKLN
jgi:type I restriction enzyme S subunit